jgi:hypothetical protein
VKLRNCVDVVPNLMLVVILLMPLELVCINYQQIMVSGASLSTITRSKKANVLMITICILAPLNKIGYQLSSAKRFVIMILTVMHSRLATSRAISSLRIIGKVMEKLIRSL